MGHAFDELRVLNAFVIRILETSHEALCDGAALLGVLREQFGGIFTLRLHQERYRIQPLTFNRFVCAAGSSPLSIRFTSHHTSASSFWISTSIDHYWTS